jgi:hypothetical protein
MTISATAWAFSQTGISPAAKLVLIMMSDCADDEGIAIVEPTRLASMCQMTLDELRKVFQDLIHRGTLERVVNEKRITRQTLVAYRLNGVEE